MSISKLNSSIELGKNSLFYTSLIIKTSSKQVNDFICDNRKSGARFSKVTIIIMGPVSCLRVVCQPGLALLFFIFRFEYLISGPKRYRDFRETASWSCNEWFSSIMERVITAYKGNCTAKPRDQVSSVYCSVTAQFFFLDTLLGQNCNHERSKKQTCE